MEFLKELFGSEALTYDQLAAKAQEKKLNVVDISNGQYVSRAKFDDRTKALEQQVTDLKAQLTQRDTDTAKLKEQLTAAQGDAGKTADVQKSLEELQKKYEADTKELNDRLTKQDYEFRVKEKASGLKFSSNGAKADFISKAIEKGFKVDGDTLQGFEDFVKLYREKDPKAFEPDKPAEPEPAPKTPQIVAPATPSGASNQNSFSGLFRFNGVRPMPQQGQ